MGKYAVWEDPVVDSSIEDLLNQILAAITVRASLRSIVLYGSLARGEASAMVSGNQVQLLSDVEIRVIDPSLHLRRLCQELSRQLTARLGVVVSIAWMHPSRLKTNRPRHLFFRTEIPSIFMYEFRSTSRTLYGEDLLSTSPPIDPADIPLSSGIRLVLNRMAESLEYLPCSTRSTNLSRLDTIKWINKTALACAEALLVSAKAYHYSCEERYRRLNALARQRLGHLVDRAPMMPDLVRRATEFKLRPNPSLYPGNLADVWAQVAAMTDIVYRYLIELMYGKSFGVYAEFPADYLIGFQPTQRNWARLSQQFSARLVQKLTEGAKYLKHSRWPPLSLFRPYGTSQIVYALVPVLFQSCFAEEKEKMLDIVRQWLGQLEHLERESQDRIVEWNYLCRRLTWYWRAFCY